jgi:hypothetical protein
MKPTHPTGLGELHIPGKRSLFQPPHMTTQPQEPVTKPQNKNIRQKKSEPKNRTQRIHVTLDLTPEALTILQEIQHKHRLRTGKALPSWKVISGALEAYAKSAQ